MWSNAQPQPGPSVAPAGTHAKHAQKYGTGTGRAQRRCPVGEHVVFRGLLPRARPRRHIARERDTRGEATRNPRPAGARYKAVPSPGCGPHAHDINMPLRIFNIRST
eukprot:scaffold22294_cov36-Phaeocystis_antarctica.AAC.2